MMIKREEKKMEDNFINFRSKEIYVCMIIIYTGSSYSITVICIQSEDSPCPSHFFCSVCSSHTLSLNFPLLSPFTRCLFSFFFFLPLPCFFFFSSSSAAAHLLSLRCNPLPSSNLGKHF